MFEYVKQNIFSIVTAIASISAMIMSARSYNLSRRQVYANVLATNRIKWVNDFRGKLAEFIDVYYQERLKQPGDRLKLRKVKFDVECFLDYAYGNKGYMELKKHLDQLVESPPDAPVPDLAPFLQASQKVLGDAYLRAKRESGVTKKMDQKIRRSIQNQE